MACCGRPTGRLPQKGQVYPYPRLEDVGLDGTCKRSDGIYLEHTHMNGGQSLQTLLAEITLIGTHRVALSRNR